MSKIDLYPSKNASPSDAQIQTGTSSGLKVGADTWILGGSVGSASVPADYDAGTVSYPSSTVEVYQFYKSAVLLKTITITYTDATKNNISNWSIA